MKTVVFLLAAVLSGSVLADDSVFKALGGKAGVDSLTETLLDTLYADERIAFLFQDSDRDNLQRTISDQICMETGGPCEYKGLPMDEAHSGLAIKHAEMDAFVEDFILAMESEGIDFRTQNRVLKIFAPMREDVVYQ